MKTINFYSCLIAALTFFVSSTGVQAQNPLVNSNKSSDVIPKDGIYKTQVDQRITQAYPQIYERDVMWEKRIWQEIDVREKRNQHFSAVERPLAKILMEAAESGKVRAFGTMDDQFKTLMTQQEIQSMLYSTDTTLVYNFETDSYEPVVTQSSFNPEDVQRYRIKEVWYIDSRRGRMDKRILGISPIINRYDESGNFIASMPICWFYFDDLRQVLATEKAPNAQNDVAFQTWDDVFMSRNFGSYITKQSNTMDRRIQDYKSGINTLYEADKIREEIRNREHDLYSY